MVNTDEIKEYLRANLSQKRYHHSLCVADAARDLAKLNGADPEKCYLTGLLHDICKEMPVERQFELVRRSEYEVSATELSAPKTYHGIAAAVFVKDKYGITDPDILSPIRWHTVGKGGMNLYEQVMYMADLVSLDRDYNDFEEIRKITYADLYEGLYEAFKWMIMENLEKCRVIPQSTFDAYNEYTTIHIKKRDKA